MTGHHWLFSALIATAVLGAVGVSVYVLTQLDILAPGTTSVAQNTVKTAPATILPSPTPVPPTPISLVFVGDMMFDRHIRQNAQKRGGYDVMLSPGLKELFAQADLVVGNLEGPVTDNPSKSVGSVVGSPANYSFTFEPAIVQFLYDHNIRLVNLGNNHILNFGQSGLEQTHELLEAGQIASFGVTGRDKEYQSWHIMTIDETRFGFVNYNQFTAGGWERALSDLEEVRPMADVVIVYTHWGNEYVPENAVLKSQAKELVAAGADLIIGSHPHVVTGTELIDSTKIYYSLGNFIFDQYFEPAVRAGLVVQADYDPTTRSFQFTDIPVKLEPNGTTSLQSEL